MEITDIYSTVLVFVNKLSIVCGFYKYVLVAFIEHGYLLYLLFTFFICFPSIFVTFVFDLFLFHLSDRSLPHTFLPSCPPHILPSLLTFIYLFIPFSFLSSLHSFPSLSFSSFVFLFSRLEISRRCNNFTI